MSTQPSFQGADARTISLVFGHPDASTLPADDLLGAAQAVLRGPPARAALAYGNEQGTPDLMEFVRDKLNRQEGLALSPDQVMIPAGSTGAPDMIARLFIQPGEAMLVEAPVYHDALRVFRDHGAELYPAPIDERGLIVKELERQLDQLRRAGTPARLLYSVPNFQNPSGVTLDAARRKDVIDLAREHGCLIVEDDVYRDIAFDEAPPPSLYALSGGQGVLRVGSFSKILAAGLRVGWLVAAPEHIRACVDCGAVQMGGGANPLAAQIVAEYCRAGKLAPHIARLRRVYAERCAATLSALERHMPPGVTWTRPSGGFFVWLTLPEGVRADPLLERARARGLTFVPGARFFARGAPVCPGAPGQTGGGERNLRLAYSFVPPDEVERGVAILAQAVQEMSA